MKPSPSYRRCIALCGALTILLTAGCVSIVKLPKVYEYRYRVFESLQPLPQTMQAPISDALLAERFVPVGALNRAMDVLASEGFELWKIERIRDSNYYTISFRREIQEGYRPTRAPMEFTGAYQAKPPADPDTLYFFSPQFKGYTVIIVPKGQKPEVVDTTWNGESLRGQNGRVEHSFLLGKDGASVSHLQEVLKPEQIERKVVELRRIPPIR